MTDSFDWVDEKEKEIKEERAKSYFDIKEGDNRFVLLSHCAPLAQVYEGGKYRPAQEGDKNVSIKGVCWVYQEGLVKQAKLPYVVVKAIRALQQNPDWEFKIPFAHVLTLKAENAGSKEVKYSLTPSPKEVPIPQNILDELAKKSKPEDIVEKIKSGRPGSRNDEDTREAPPPTGGIEYPKDDINPDDIPFR